MKLSARAKKKINLLIVDLHGSFLTANTNRQREEANVVSLKHEHHAMANTEGGRPFSFEGAGWNFLLLFRISPPLRRDPAATTHPIRQGEGKFR